MQRPWCKILYKTPANFNKAQLEIPAYTYVSLLQNVNFLNDLDGGKIREDNKAEYM